ncbi:MAG: hypothetical protein OI860_00125 (plasmid) [Candidatus Methanoperedens sp.]|nr:MAG: hypothetical protein OI863_00340 [Candidatus Methanoperedens sp.]WAM22202.1 MAG: hypothetical protein OI860_00125 [Candidatus Methanoperedens sp.]
MGEIRIYVFLSACFLRKNFHPALPLCEDSQKHPISFIKDIKNPSTEGIAYKIIFFAYWLPFTLFIWAALRIK